VLDTISTFIALILFLQLAANTHVLDSSINREMYRIFIARQHSNSDER